MFAAGHAFADNITPLSTQPDRLPLALPGFSSYITRVADKPYHADAYAALLMRHTYRFIAAYCAIFSLAYFTSTIAITCRHVTPPLFVERDITRHIFMRALPTCCIYALMLRAAAMMLSRRLRRVLTRALTRYHAHITALRASCLVIVTTYLLLLRHAHAVYVSRIVFPTIIYAATVYAISR